MLLMIGNVDADAEGQVQVGPDGPLVADVAAELGDAELGATISGRDRRCRSRGSNGRRRRSRSCRGC